MDRNRFPRRSAPPRAFESQRVNTCPIKNESDNCLCVNQPVSLAMSYVKKQTLNNIYPLFEGWRNGTIFPELNLPYCAGGNRR